MSVLLSHAYLVRLYLVSDIRAIIVYYGANDDRCRTFAQVMDASCS